MPIRGRWRYAALAVVTGVVGLPAVQAGAEARPPGPVTQQVTQQVTLVTGDKVILRSRGGAPVQVKPGPGRTRVRFRSLLLDGHRYVIPGDAARLIGEGRLDRRLFDLTQLLAWNYDDAHRRDVPLIVDYSRGGSPRALSGGRVTQPLPALGADAVRVEKAQAAAFWARLAPGGANGGAKALAGGVAKVWLDGKVKASLDKSVPQVGAPQAWRRGFTGKGSTVAVLDTGYDPAHPDLKGVVSQSRGFTDKGASDVTDRVGHGTHVSSTVAGSGAASHGKYKGVAPGAKIAMGKVLNDDGYGQDSWIMAGMQWAATQVKARVVSLSLGGVDTQELDPLERAVNGLTRRTGTLFVIAAGNDGSPRSIGSPGTADAALTVGAVDKKDVLAEFSSRGPRVGDFAVKPDITAPGVDITAAAAKGTSDGPYVTASGTSMATPHVAGGAAILAQQHPDWTAERLKAALIGAAKPAPKLPAYAQGAGRLDLDRATGQQVTAAPGNTSAYLRWPDHKPVIRTVTYTNTSAAPLTLKLGVSGTRDGGGAAPGGLFGLSAKQIKVPARGTAAVRLTVTGWGVRTGAYSGVLTATAGKIAVRTIVGAYVEPKSHDLTVKAIDRNGKPAESLLTISSQTEPTHEMIITTGGATRVRLPAGGYNIHGVVDTYGANPEDCGPSAVVDKKVSLTGAGTTVIDTRKAKQVRMSVADPTAQKPEGFETGYSYKHGRIGHGLIFIAFSCSVDDLYVLPERQPGLAYYSLTSWEKRGSTPQAPSPYRYELLDYREDQLPTDPGYAADSKNMTALTVSQRTQNAADQGLNFVGGTLPRFDFGPFASDSLHRLPATTTYYLVPDQRIKWWRTLEFGSKDENDPGPATIDAPPRAFPKGSHRETFNAAAAGPALDLAGGSPATRTGDRITYEPWAFFSDGVRGHEGSDARATGTITLARGGQVIKKVPFRSEDGLVAGVPAGAGGYTLTASATKKAPSSTLSTAVEAVWTFRSGHTGRKTSLPLQAVRFAPGGLDDLNRAKPGSVTKIPLWVERARGAAPATVKQILVEASYDDGRTWRKLPADQAGGGWTTSVQNPASGFVSLRATVSDTAGDTVRQTIARAYAIGG